METEVKKGWKQWEERQVPNLFQEKIKELLEHNLKQKQKVIKKHIHMLEETKNTEPDNFRKEPGRPNLLAYFYINPSNRELDKAMKLVDISLQKEPENICALVNHFQIMITRNKFNEAKEVLKKLNALDEKTDSKVLYLVAKAEVAYCLSYMGPVFYLHAIEMYESAMTQLDNLTETEKEHALIKEKSNAWKFHLAQTYSRMMNRGNNNSLFLKGYDVHDVYKKVTSILIEVIESKDEFYHGKALLDLADFYKKYETNGGTHGIPFPYKMSLDECINEAYRIGKDKDAYVLERCGRHYRQRASNENEFLYALNVLMEALKVCPARHMAHHQMGLVYKQLWLEKGGHKESRLHTNKRRRGNKNSHKRRLTSNDNANGSMKPERKKQTQNSIWENNDDSRKQTKEAERSTMPQFVQPRSLKPNDICLPKSPTKGSSDRATTHAKFSTTGKASKSTNSSHHSGGNKEPCLVLPPSPLPTIIPKFTSLPGKTPKHPSRPDYFSKQRVSNPQQHIHQELPNVAGEYLNRAVECFEKATEIVNNTSCRYLVDLGRSYISVGRLHDAEESFVKANNREEIMQNDNDAQYLYEQWALKWDKHKDEEAGSRDDIKEMYRKAIKSAVRANLQSKIAFYNLKDILKEELKQNPADEALQLEQAVLLQGVGQYTQAEHFLVTSLKKNPEKVNIVWKLVELYNRRGKRHDASAALTYLTVLEKAGKLCLYDDTSSKRRITIDLAKKAAEESELKQSIVTESDDQPRDIKPHLEFKEIFGWLVGSTTFLTRGFESISDETINSKYKLSEICLLAWDHVRHEDTAVSRLWKLLEKWCDLDEGVTCIPDDIQFNHPKDKAARAIISKTKALVIVLDDKKNNVVDDSGQDEQWLQAILFHLNEMKLQNNICFVAGSDSDRNIITQYNWPCFTLNQDCTDSDVVSHFFKVLFQANETTDDLHEVFEL